MQVKVVLLLYSPMKLTKSYYRHGAKPWLTIIINLESSLYIPAIVGIPEWRHIRLRQVPCEQLLLGSPDCLHYRNFSRVVPEYANAKIDLAWISVIREALEKRLDRVIGVVTYVFKHGQ